MIVAMKRCWSCDRHLPLSAFNKNSYKADGLDARCRHCGAAAGAKRVRKESEASKRKRALREKGREFDPKKLSAQRKLQSAVRSGNMIRWPVCAMPTCEKKRVEAHHADYDNPLGVTWLCASHHRLAHYLIREQK